MEKLNNRQKMAEMKARIIDEWIALSPSAFVDELEDHLYEIAEECENEISFHLDKDESISVLLNGDSLRNLSCFEWIADIKVNGLFDFTTTKYYCNVIFTVKL